MEKERVWRPAPNAGRNPVATLAAWLGGLFVHGYGRMKIVGRENVPSSGGVLLVANHASYVDPLMIGVALHRRRRTYFMGKSELFRNPFVCRVFTQIGGFPIRRGSPDRAAVRHILQFLAQGDAVLIFPEGERTRTGLLSPALPGIALIVHKSGVPIVPIGLIGTYAMAPAHRRTLRRVPLTIAFGKPICFDRDTPREEITASVMRAIAELLTTNGQPTEPPEELLPRERQRAHSMGD